MHVEPPLPEPARTAPPCARSAPYSAPSRPHPPSSRRTRSPPCSPTAERSAIRSSLPAMTEPDPTMARVAGAMELGRAGRRAEAR